MRFVAWVTLALLVTSLGVGELVAGQLPIPLPSGGAPAGVEVKAANIHLIASLDEPAVVEIIVTNTGSPTGTPLDQPRDVVLVISGVPAEWTIAIAPAAFELGPGQSGTATLTAAVSAKSNSTAVITVTARLSGLGATGVPGIGPQIDPEATASTQITIERTDSPARVLIETVGPYIWALVLALIAAIVVIFSVIAANRRVALRLSAADSEQVVGPGQRATFPMTAHNITRRADTIVVSPSALEAGWAAFLPTIQLQLEAGQQEEISIILIAPRDAAEGARQTVQVTATSAQAPRHPAHLSFTAVVGPVALRRKKGE